MLDSIKTLPMPKVQTGLMTSQKPVPRDGAACPFCGQLLQVRAKDGYVIIPLHSKEGKIQLKCRSRDCHDRWIDVDLQATQT